MRRFGSDPPFFRDNGSGDSALDLFRYDDWWEHDGLHLSRKDDRISFDALLSLVQTPTSLEAAMTGDIDVFIGIAPQNFEWYVRFHLERETVGRFDLTLPEPLVEPYRRQVAAPMGLSMVAQESHAYYLSVGMGSYPYSEEQSVEIRKQKGK